MLRFPVNRPRLPYGESEMSESTNRLAAFRPLCDLAKPNSSKIIMFVMDGLGGLPGPEGKSELEVAQLPNLDALAREGVCGLVDPVGRSITPGSGPGHLGLFGYDPLLCKIGRGALAAAGIGFALKAGDVAARFNFCTIDEAGNVTDRRAGRIPTEKNVSLLPKLREIRIPGVEIFLEAVREYRGLVVFRGEGLGHRVCDTDPQAVGVPPLPAEGEDEASERTAEVANRFLAEVKKALAEEQPANYINLRGFDRRPDIPTLEELYQLKSAGIATYPMYRGLARFVGMTVPTEGIECFEDELATLEKLWGDYDFFFIHYKYTDSAGEDGDFARKVAKLEEADGAVPRLLALKPDVLVVTGDHSTPAMYKAHSWHPVPAMLRARFARRDGVTTFTEQACLGGGLGRMPARHLMGLMLAHADRLEKFGA